MVALIGGIETESGLRRDVVLRPLSGAVELALSETRRAALSLPDKVSRFLAETVETIGGQGCDTDLAADLSVGDRQHLMRQIGLRLGGDAIWLSECCPTCDEVFDVRVVQSDLPVKPAGEGYPYATLEGRGTDQMLRSPTGRDQAAIATLPEEQARGALVRRLAGKGAGEELSASFLDAVDAAIEAVSPEIALSVVTACPDCGAEVAVPVDPYRVLAQPGDDILDEVHLLALNYHWSEEAILALPRARRQAYLARIDRARGMLPASEGALS